MPSDKTTKRGSFPQPDGVMMRVIEDAIWRTAERYPVAGTVMAAIDKLPKRVRLQFEADLCNQMGLALTMNGIDNAL